MGIRTRSRKSSVAPVLSADLVQRHRQSDAKPLSEADADFAQHRQGLGVLHGFVTAGIGAYAGEAGLASKVGLSQYLGSDASLAFNAMVANIATQGLGRVTGWQESFSWRSVAVSALAAPLADWVGDLIEGDKVYDSAGRVIGRRPSAYSGIVGNFGA